MMLLIYIYTKKNYLFKKKHVINVFSIKTRYSKKMQKSNSCKVYT